MSRRNWLGVWLAILLATPALAQDPVNLDQPEADAREFVPPANQQQPLWSSPQQPEPSMASEQWLRQQETRRKFDTQQAVRRKAELKAAQRADRIATLQWYGVSNLRPTMSNATVASRYPRSWVAPGVGQVLWPGAGRRGAPLGADTP